MTDAKHKFRPFQQVMWCDAERGRNWRAYIKDTSYGKAVICITDNDWTGRRFVISVSVANLLPVD
jgi:hypothetical protein